MQLPPPSAPPSQAKVLVLSAIVDVLIVLLAVLIATVPQLGHAAETSAAVLPAPSFPPTAPTVFAIHLRKEPA